jgi:hypothetical protein
MKRRKLDAGFHLLYEQKPVEARALSEAWLKSHPADPLLSALGAASYLFEECYRQSVSPSEFFFNDKRFLGKIPFKPDPELCAAFFAADKQAQGLAQLRLKETEVARTQLTEPVAEFPQNPFFLASELTKRSAN